MKNLVQQFIDERTDWLETLERDYKIDIVRDGSRVSLKYNQIESPMHEPIVQQCRGMVVDVDRHQVLAWPYNKFWNHGEALADRVDWSVARVQEKLDGSLMILYWVAAAWHVRLGQWIRRALGLSHDERRGWCVASSGHPTAGGSFGSDERTFGAAFWDTWNELGCTASDLDREATYMLELCDTPNRVVVRHERPRLVLHGARYLRTGDEMTRAELLAAGARMRCETVAEFPIGTIDACLAAAEALDPIKQEGFVVVDSNFNRVKIKSPRYITLHHLKGEATPRRAIELWQSGDASELLAHFPEFRPVIEPVHERLDDIARQAASEHEEALCRSFDRKSYAAMATRYPFSAVMFRMLTDGTTTVDAAKAIMRRMSLAALERMVLP